MTGSLNGWGVELVPLQHAHAHGLMAAVGDGEIYRLHYTTAPEPTAEAVARYIDQALAGQAARSMLPFAVIAGGETVGSTRFYDIDPDGLNACIGYTWYAARVQRTHVNTAAKRLLLQHAFDTMRVKSVYFHTSHLNTRSQAAIERLGATLDGVIRHHKTHRDGSLRDTYWYSITVEEWPAVRERLNAKLANIAR